MSVWIASPLLLVMDPTLLGTFQPHTRLVRLCPQHVADVAGRRDRRGRVLRTIQLFFLRDVQTGLVWLTKILTDPFHDVMLYYKAPLHLLRGEFIDPIVSHETAVIRWPRSPAGKRRVPPARAALAADGFVRERRRVPPPAVFIASSRAAATKRSATASKSSSE